MLTEELYVYKDLIVFIKQLYKYLNNIKKDIRYGEYSTTLKYSHLILDMLYEANSNIDTRRKTLNKILYLLNGVKNRIRIIGELKYISLKQLHYLVFLLDGIFKQIIAWRNKS